MAKANQVKLCPHCKSMLADPIPQECPVCGQQIITPENTHFGSPDYLYFQREHHLNKIINEDYKKNQRAATETELRQAVDLETALVRWVRNSTPEEKLAALYDARLILSHVLHSKISGEALGQLVSLGKSIGKVAESLDQYMRAGGQVYDGKTKSVLPEPGRDGWDSEAVG